MNAVMIKAYEFDERELMPINEDDLQVQVARLETNVQHIQSDVSDMKIDLRATNQRIDTLSEKMDTRIDALSEKVDTRIDALSEKMDTRIDALSEKMEVRIDTLSEKMDTRFDAAKEEMNKRFDAIIGDTNKGFDKSDSRMDKADVRMDRIEEKLNGIMVKLESWKAWALGLYAALAATLLGVMAKGFKWF